MGVAVINFYIDLLFKFLLVKDYQTYSVSGISTCACYNNSTYS